MINKIKWFAVKQVDLLDLNALFAIDYGYSLDLEEAMLDMPFIAIRLRRNWKLKGHVVWYSLETQATVIKKDIEQWKKTTQRIR